MSEEIKVLEEEKQMFICPIHGEYEYKPDAVSFGGHIFRKIKACPICIKEIEERLEIEREEVQMSRKLQSMNIEKLYHKSTFDNFNAYNDELCGHLKTCREFADNPDGKLVMLGKNGTGKTHLAISILKSLGGVIYTAYEIGVNLRDFNGPIKEKEVLNELCSVPLLVIDEIEKMKNSETKQDWMSHVIGKRYNRMLPLIIIGNCHTHKDCPERISPCSDCLESHLENDVISRIMEDGIIMKFSSNDYRRTIREKRMAL
jgi:DNA replication protein DnaC